MMIPVGVDVPMERYPWVNFGVIGFTVLIFFTLSVDGMTEETIEQMILDGWSLSGLLGHLLLHGGLGHLLGNMLFLWVFGNAVCAKVGNPAFAAIYIGLGVTAGVIHVLFDGSPAIGASGAINGVVGMFLIFYPLNDIRIWYWFSPVFMGEFSLSSVWMILLWLAFDVIGALGGSPGVAYWAHIGGLVGGAGLAWGLLAGGLVQMTETERSLLEVIQGEG